jgi:hypothetical protein
MRTISIDNVLGRRTTELVRYAVITGEAGKGQGRRDGMSAVDQITYT